MSLVTAWNDAEDEALQGLPLAAQLLYLRGLRRFMDYSTGVVGVRRRVSWQGLHEVLHVPHHQGMDEVSYNKNQLKRLMGWLVKAGLLEDRTTGKYLVFFLPLADVDKSAQKKADPRPTHVRPTKPDPIPDPRPTHDEASNGAGFDGSRLEEPDPIPDPRPTHVRPVKADPPPVSGKPVNPSTSQAASPEVNGVDAANVLRIAAALAARGSDESPLDEDTSRKLHAVYECLRGQGVVFNALDRDRLVGWVHQNVTPVQVHAAVQIAKQRRAADGSQQRITVAYLAAILPDVINPPKPKGPPWWSSDAAMQAKARELGIAEARVGETLDQFKARITAAIRQQQGGAA